MIILYAIPFFMLLIAAEAVLDLVTRKKYVRFNDAVNSLSTGMLSRTMGFLMLYLNWAAYDKLFGYFGWQTLDNSAVNWVIAFVLYDFLYYWSHRLAHTYSIFWNAHAVHHQSEEFNLTTALRQPFTGIVQGSIVYLPMVVLGFSPETVLTVGSLNLIYQFWVHTRYVPKMGLFEQIFVTPSNHRVHHGMNDRYIDTNFGGVFILWDRWFKTFQEELDEDPVIFGIRKPLQSFNPFYANVQVFAQLLRDIRIGGSFRLALKILISRTGQRPEEIEQKLPLPRLDLAQFKPFNPQAARSVKVLVWSQLLFSLGYTVWFMMTVPASPFLPALLHFLPLGLALLSMGQLMENRRSGWYSELLRLIYILFAMTWLPMQWPHTFMLSYLLLASLLLGITATFAMRPNATVASGMLSD